MEDTNISFQTYSGYEYVSGKSKKKRKQRKKNRTSLEEMISETESSPALESGADSNLTDDNVSDLEPDGATSDRLKTEELIKEDKIKKRVSTDAMLKAAPTINVEEETIADKQNLLEANVTKMYIEDNKVNEYETEPTEYSFEGPQEINTKALSKDASTYELEKFEKNALIIFNQENIKGHSARLGTEKDVEVLTKTFEKFNFDVVEHKDFTKDEIFKELKTFSEQNFTDYGCVAVAVLTHGSNKGLLRAKDQQYSEIEIINHFKVLNKPTLVTKPKIIIIQACRGTKLMAGAPVYRSGKIRKDLDGEVEPYILPVESDILILHSSYSGSPSYRNDLHGSWFIQELCSKINSLSSTHDLESIITEVKREVAINKQDEEYNRRTFEMDIYKQMPVMTSTLIRKLYLRTNDEVSKNVETLTDKPRGSVSSESREVLNGSVPSTPLMVQFGPCSCFLDHFNYMRNCLKYFVEENPKDETALHLLELAYSFEESVEFNTPKEKTMKLISKHLLNNARSCQFYKYLYFYKH